jgi:hypothetical protein
MRLCTVVQSGKPSFDTFCRHRKTARLAQLEEEVKQLQSKLYESESQRLNWKASNFAAQNAIDRAISALSSPRSDPVMSAEVNDATGLQIQELGPQASISCSNASTYGLGPSSQNFGHGSGLVDALDPDTWNSEKPVSFPLAGPELFGFCDCKLL